MLVVDDTLLQEMVRRLVEEFHPEQVILIGSRAWGTPGPDSDVDLLVIVSDSDMPPSRRAQRAHQCLRGIMVPKDVLVRTRAEVEKFRHVYASLECQALEQGKVLYG
ncbi:MAG: nucleotidyltransferase domain-containing protein [Phycisphaerae bacterium]